MKAMTSLHGGLCCRGTLPLSWGLDLRALLPWVFPLAEGAHMGELASVTVGAHIPSPTVEHATGGLVASQG